MLFLEIWICDYWKLEDKYALFYSFIFQDTSRRYENKAGAFITGIDVNSKVQVRQP